MTSIVELEDNFPENTCFHDSIITNIDIDYENNKAVINIQLCSGDPESSDIAKREAYTEAQLAITGIIYFIIEPPDYEYLKKFPNRLENEGLWVDIGFSKNPSQCIKLPQPLPKGAFYNWFFVNKWNSYIHIAAMDATIKFK